MLDLFAGIGGFSLAARRVGWETVAFCEIDPYCQRVLAKHWPGVPIHSDVRELTGEQVGPVDIITGGFPCQDISVAGKAAGIEGARSGLWSEIARLIDELRPQYAVMENVAALLGRGMGRVLGDLAEIGYDAEWHCIPASYAGAPHIRDRVWIIAHSDQDGPGPVPLFAGRIQAQKRSQLWKPFRADDFAVRVQELARVCEADDGIPEEVGAYGNSIVPQVAEMIFRAIDT